MRKPVPVPVYKRTGKLRKSIPKAVEEVLFDRDNGKRIPLAVRDAAELWLDMFMDLAGLTAPEKPEGYRRVDSDSQRQWLLGAAELADFSLALYEERWPHESHKKS